MSSWLFDIGNSRVKCAPLRGDGEFLDDVRIEVAHDGAALPDGWDAQLPATIDRAFVASVANPALAAALLDALTMRCTRITRARTLRACMGVRIAYAEPSRLGVDRFLGLLAAHARAADAWLVIGVGTALTIDLLGADGHHLGGRIAPSPTLMREALHARAPQLPPGGGIYADFAADTVDGLASGCEGAALALIADSRARAVARLGSTPRVIVHGGGSDALLPHLPDVVAAPGLVLEGLARWAHTLSR